MYLFNICYMSKKCKLVSLILLAGTVGISYGANVEMAPDKPIISISQQIGEVLYAVCKESLIRSLQTLKNEKLTDITTPSVENMLNGKLSGVYVAPDSGLPGTSGVVVVRRKAMLSSST